MNIKKQSHASFWVIKYFGLLACSAFPIGILLPTTNVYADSQVQVELFWPDADHVRAPGRYMLEGRYRIDDPDVVFAKAGFIINNTPYDAVTLPGNKFAFGPRFRPGEYLIEAFIVNSEGHMLPGEAHRLYVKKGVSVIQPETDALPVEQPQAEVNQPVAVAVQTHSALKGEGLKVYLEFDAPREGQAWGTFMIFPPVEPGIKLEPTIQWQGNRFEAFLRYQKPHSEIWDESRKVIAQTEWDIRYRVFGNVAADHQSLQAITFEYKAECRVDNGQLWEYYEGHFALNNVPGQAGVVSSNNPIANTPPRYQMNYRIDGKDRATLDHVLELSYRHGYPAYPETEYQISTTALTRVNFTFDAW